jgi:hypothetical protein
MTQTTEHFHPLPANRQHIDRMYALYNEIYPALRGTLTRLRRESLSRENEGIQ